MEGKTCKKRPGPELPTGVSRDTASINFAANHSHPCPRRRHLLHCDRSGAPYHLPNFGLYRAAPDSALANVAHRRPCRQRCYWCLRRPHPHLRPLHRRYGGDAARRVTETSRGPSRTVARQACRHQRAVPSCEHEDPWVEVWRRPVQWECCRY